MDVGRPVAASGRESSMLGSLLEVRDGDGNTVAVALMDGEARTWAFAPEDGMFHRDDAKFRDFYSDDPRFEYVPLTQPRAEALMGRGLGASQDAPVFDEVRRQPAMTVGGVFATVEGRRAGADR